MGDVRDCPCTWMDKAKAIALVVSSIGGVIAGAIAAWYGSANHSQLGEVRGTQAVQVQKAEEVKAAVDARDEKLDKVADKFAERSRDEVKATAINLKASWTYLRQVAEDTGKVEDKNAAKTAEKAYHDFTRKYGLPE